MSVIQGKLFLERISIDEIYLSMHWNISFLACSSYTVKCVLSYTLFFIFIASFAFLRKRYGTGDVCSLIACNIGPSLFVTVYVRSFIISFVSLVSFIYQYYDFYYYSLWLTSYCCLKTCVMSSLPLSWCLNFVRYLFIITGCCL